MYGPSNPEQGGGDNPDKGDDSNPENEHDENPDIDPVEQEANDFADTLVMGISQTAIDQLDSVDLDDDADLDDRIDPWPSDPRDN